MYLKLLLFVCIVLIKQTMSSEKEITLNSGHKMPTLGLGTGGGIVGRVVYEMVSEAIGVGYRHIDTAYIHGNEMDVGMAIEEQINKGNLKREDVFITTKLWNTFHSKSKAIEGTQLALDKLNVKYIDLMLIQWPMGYEEGGDDVPMKEGDIVSSQVDYLETWEALEQMVDEGLIKSIGVSNFNSEQIERLVQNSKIKPAVNQIESHPKFTQKPLIDFCAKYDIAVIAYSPLGGGRLIDDTTLETIGKNHNKSPAQVMIRYQIQRGVSTIPRSVEKERISENFNVFDFSLTNEEIEQIDKMNLDLRYNSEDKAQKNANYPFNIPY